jgi:hypothetical protein
MHGCQEGEVIQHMLLLILLLQPMACSVQWVQDTQGAVL